MPSSRGIATHKLRHRALLYLLFVSILGAFSVTVSSAQDEAAIRGTLNDATGSAIAGGTVRIKNLETGLMRTSITDDSGRYEAPGLPVGAYEVSAEKAGGCRRAITHRRRHYLYVDEFAPVAIRAEAALVTNWRTFSSRGAVAKW